MASDADKPVSLSRRTLVGGACGAAGSLIAAPFLSFSRHRLFAWTTQEYSTRCVDLVRGSLVIDMLGLTSLNDERRAAWGASYDALTEDDIAEFRDSEIDVFHIARGGRGSHNGGCAPERPQFCRDFQFHHCESP